VKWLTIILAALLLAIQWPLWLGPGGWLRVWDLQRQLGRLQAANELARAANQAQAAEIASLERGSEAIVERARSALHMARRDEIFFQFREAKPAAPAVSGVPLASSDPLKLGAE
jgi:cell division protein FtsB